MVYKDPEERTLVDQLPELLEYLGPGLTVLDVGCRTGSITLDVAKVIKSGRIVGIDIDGESIQAATALAKAQNASNASFEVMDAHELRFADDTFDLVYSYTVAHFLWDPTQVLRELKRVTKPGSWVITAGIRDFGFIPRYPACPMHDQVWAGLLKSMEARREAYRSGIVHPRGYWDLHAGRKCVQWYTDAGFEDMWVSSRVEDWWYPGAPGKDTFFFEATHFQHEGFVHSLIDQAIADGCLDWETVDKACEEMAQWAQNPHAFYFHPLVIAGGRA